MLIKALGWLIGTLYLAFFWVAGPFSLYVLFFQSAGEIRDWFLLMAGGAILVTLLSFIYEKTMGQRTPKSNPLGLGQFAILPLGLAATALNILISLIASVIAA